MSLFAGTPLEIPYLKFRRQRLAVVAFWILAFLYLSIPFEGFLAPYRPNTKFRDKSFHPPHVVHFFHQGVFIGPFVYEYEMINPFFKEYRVDRTTPHRLTLFAKGDPYPFLFIFEFDRHLFGTTDGAPVFIMGTDNLGRCLLSRIIYGAKISLTIGFVSVFLALAGGILVGGISGLAGGITDWIIMRITEIVMLLPTFYLFLFLRSIIPTDVTPAQKFLYLTAILSVTGWAASARGIRNWVLSLKNADFVMAAAISGAPPIAILLRHVIPQIRHLLILSITLGVPGVILGESGLSFLNLGITEPSVSWGMLMTAAADVNVLRLYPWVLIPAVVIILTVFCFFALAYGLQEAFNPKSAGAA